ncbi:PrpR N-terminal domain-containing protein [Halobacillus seohaensis]|uniref:PrpR N-terminal domain-containing protein n=1 Tax=Halobacillus seohaensis TaxID=447421 RepID=A0ABW2ENC5_9BACI
MIKTLVIAPYQGLAEIVKSYQNYDNELQVDIKLGNLEDGVSIAKRAESEGYDIIISRGGTSNLIQEETNLPVVDIKVSGYDMLRIFTLLKGTNGKAALVGFSNISRGASTICSILDMEVQTITISNSEEVNAHLDGLKREHYSVVIGDVVTVQQAEKIGLQGILITSGKEAVLDSFEEAKRLYHLFQGMQSQASVYSEAIEQFPQPMITLDQKGQVALKNHSYRKELGEDLVSSPQFQGFLEQTFTENIEMWTVVHYHGKSYQLRAYPLNDDKKLVNFIIQNDLLTEEEGIEIHTHPSRTSISGDSSFARNLRNSLQHYVAMDSPLWIEGEQGTGRMMYAANIHFESYGHRAPLLSINLLKISVVQLNEILSKAYEQLPKKGTIVFLNVHELAIEEQVRIKDLVQKLSNRYKVMIISNDGMEELVKEKRIDHDLYFKLPNALIYLPPLCERIEDVKDLVQAFITQNHMNYGNETIGIREDALSLLLEYPWPGNVDQLKKTVEKLMVTSETSYIEGTDVERVLQDSGRQSQANTNDTMKIEGTLKDMEKKIIQQVMEQEKNNQSKVANRLGMNRTTLWRKLNS